MTYSYPSVYHAALNHLINHGAWERTQQGRDLCARALRALRRHPDHFNLRWERNHMRQICGSFPVKPSHPLAIS